MEEEKNINEEENADLVALVEEASTSQDSEAEAEKPEVVPEEEVQPERKDTLDSQEFEGVEKVEDIPKGKEKNYGI